MRIVVNGVERDWQGNTIGYRDVVRLASGGLSPVMSVTYHWKGEGDLSRDGTLYEGKPDIEAADGMVFNAVRTGSA